MVKRLLVRFLVLYVGIVAVMYGFQRRLQYFPDTAYADAAMLGMADIQQVSLATPDGETLVAWHVNPAPGKPVILYFHGNAGSIAGRPQRFTYYKNAGYGVLYVSYRGYGGSTGSPTEQGLLTDGLTAYDWLQGKGFEAEDIVVVGESLGTGVAVHVAANRDISALALEAPYSSITDVAASSYWWLPVRYLLKDRYESISRIGSIRVPLLITHGTADRVVPFEFGQRLFEAANQPKQFRTVEGAGHEAIFERDTWAASIQFFSKVLAGS